MLISSVVQRLWIFDNFSALVLFSIIFLHQTGTVSGSLLGVPQTNQTATTSSQDWSPDLNITFPISSVNISERDADDLKKNIFRGRLGNNVIFSCAVFNATLTKKLYWWYRSSEAKNGRLIGSFEPNSEIIDVKWTRDGSYEILKKGELMLRNVSRDLVEKYECISETEKERVISWILFRLDFSFWYSLHPTSLFFGGCLSALFLCTTSFLLHVIWMACQKTILWWINRAERMSRVRSLVEAMEKYRQRQMEALQETYNRRVNAIRDNYHSQVEQVRSSYANQADRFRDYRQAQMDNVTQHLDNIRENYNQQIHRIREYGSRRTERLWESYERQMNRIKMFTLQHRLKLERQYQVKQRYINKLLETVAESSNPDDIEKKEAAIRAVLDLMDPAHPVFPQTSLLRSCSYYSLPEFVMDDETDGFTNYEKEIGGGPMRNDPLLGSRRLIRNVKGGGQNVHHIALLSERPDDEAGTSGINTASFFTKPTQTREI